MSSIAKHSGRFFGASLLGGMASAILIVPAVIDVMQSKGIGGEGFGLSFGTEFPLSSLAQRLLPFHFNWANIANDLPNIYAGVFCLVMAVCFFAAKGISVRQKISGGGVLLFLLLSLYSTDLMLVFHVFTPPVWFTYRHAYLIVFWLCFLATMAFCKGKYTNKTLVAVGFVLTIIFVSSYPLQAEMFTPKRFVLAVCIAVAVFACVLLAPRFKNTVLQSIALCVCLVITIGELGLNAYWSLNQFEQYPQDEYVQFVEKNNDLLNQIKATEPENNYRVEKNTFRSLNDSMLLNYYGITHFGSTQDTNVAWFLPQMGYIEGTAQQYGSGENNIFADSFLGIRYLIAQNGGRVPSGYVKTDICNEYATVYKNPYAFPLVFVVPQQVQNIDWTKNKNHVEMQENIFSLFSKQPLFLAVDTVDLDALQTVVSQLSKDVIKVELQRGNLHATIDTQQEEIIFISVPYNENYKIFVNNKQATPIPLFHAMLGVVVPKGYSEITVQYKTPGATVGVILSIFAVLLSIAWKVILKRKGDKKCQYSSLPRQG